MAQLCYVVPFLLLTQVELAESGGLIASSRPRTRTTGRAPRGAQVCPFGGLSPWPASSSKQMWARRSAALPLPAATPRPSIPRSPRRRVRSSRSRRQPRTDRDATRSSLATASVLSPRANHSAASRRTRSRFSCSLGVSPPPCAYRMTTSYRNDQEPSRAAGLCEFNLSNTAATLRDWVWAISLAARRRSQHAQRCTPCRRSGLRSHCDGQRAPGQRFRPRYGFSRGPCSREACRAAQGPPHSAPGPSSGRKGDADWAPAERLGGRHRTLSRRFVSRPGKLHTHLSTR